MTDKPTDERPETNEEATGGSAGATPEPEPAVDSAGAGSDPGTPPVKADLVKRFLAALVDGVAMAIVTGVLTMAVPILGFFVGVLVGAAYLLVRDGLNVEFMDQRSLGKKLLKLRPVRLDGSRIDLNDSVKRNWVFAVPNALQVIPILGTIVGGLLGLVITLVEVILVLTDPQGRRWGDKLAETVVIEVDD